MRRTLFPFAVLALASCGSEPPPVSDAEDAEIPVANASDIGELVASADRLAGEYRVAGVGGQGIDLPYAITASIGADRIHLTADCVNMAWNYHFEGAIFATRRVPTQSCERALTAEEEALVAAFDGADRVSYQSTGAYEITGTGPQVTLFTQ